MKRSIPGLAAVALSLVSIGSPRLAAAAAGSPNVGSVVVNEYNAINAPVGHDYFELLVTVDSDLRGLRVTDNEVVSGLVNQGESVFVFSQDSFLESVGAGTTITVWTSPGVTTDTVVNPATNDQSMTLAPGVGLSVGVDGLGGAVVTGLQTTGDGLYVYLPGPDGTSAGSDNVYLDFVSWEDDGGEAPQGMADLNLPAQSDAAYSIGGCSSTGNDGATNWVRHGSAFDKTPSTPGTVNPKQDLSGCKKLPSNPTPPVVQPTSPVLRQDQVVFNEFSADKGDFVELLILADDVDLRGVRITDNDLQPSGKFKNGESVLVVSDDLFLSKLPKGTTVVLATKLSNPLEPDQDSSDGTLVLLPGRGFSVSDDGLGGKVDSGWSAKGDALYLYSVIDRVGLRSAGSIEFIDYLPWGKHATLKPSSSSIVAPIPPISEAYASNMSPCTDSPAVRSSKWTQRTRSPGRVNFGQNLGDCSGSQTAVDEPVPSAPTGFTLATRLTDWDLKGPFGGGAPDMVGSITLPAGAHNNGMAVTAKGVIVGNYKRSDTSMQLHSWSPGKSNWIKAVTDFPGFVEGSNRWPSGMQAAGELIAFTDTKYVRFAEWSPKGLGQFRSYDFEIPRDASNEVVGFTYDAKRKRYFLALANSGGGIWASPIGEPYQLANGNANAKFRFTKIANGGVGFGEAGISLVVDPYSGQLLVLSFGPTDAPDQATYFDFRWVLLDPRGDKGKVGERLFLRGVPGVGGPTTFGPSFRWGATATINGAHELRIWAMPRRQTVLEQLGEVTTPVYWTLTAPK